MKTSAALDRISPSPTLAITTKVQELKRAGIDVIGLGAGAAMVMSRSAMTA